MNKIKTLTVAIATLISINTMSALAQGTAIATNYTGGVTDAAAEGFVNGVSYWNFAHMTNSTGHFPILQPPGAPTFCLVTNTSEPQNCDWYIEVAERTGGHYWVGTNWILFPVYDTNITYLVQYYNLTSPGLPQGTIVPSELIWFH